MTATWSDERKGASFPAAIVRLEAQKYNKCLSVKKEEKRALFGKLVSSQNHRCLVAPACSGFSVKANWAKFDQKNRGTSLRIWTRLFKSVFPWVQPWCRKKPSKKKQDQPLWSRIKIKPITNPPPAAVTKIEQEPNASIEWQCFYTQVLVPAKCMESCLEGSPNIYAQAKSDMPNLQRDRRVDGSQNENMTDISCLVLWGQSQRQSDWDGLSESGGGIESSERKCCHAGAEED